MVRGKYMNDELKMMSVLQPNKLFITENRDHTLYEYYLLGTIGDPDMYVDLCHALRSARPEDKFVIRINSGGGQMRTGNQILNAIHECDALTIGFIEHDCGSMATFIFLGCKTWAVSKYAEWFSHTVSGGAFGKECETFEASQFLRKQTHKRIREEYSGFLSDQEIESVLKGSDIYLCADEIMDRLENFKEIRDTLNRCEDPDCGECEEEFNLIDIIDEQVASGVEKGLEKLLKNYDLVEKQKPEKTKSSRKLMTETGD